MNCLYITLFLNIVAGIVQTFTKSWNQLLYRRVIEVCRYPLNHVMTSSCTSSSSSKLFPSEMFLWVKKQVEIDGHKVRTVRRMVQYIPLEFFQKRSGDVRGMGPRHAFGGTLDRRCRFKHVSFKQSRFYHCQTSTAHR